MEKLEKDHRIIDLLKRDPRSMSRREFKELIYFERSLMGFDESVYSFSFEFESVFCVVRHPLVLYLTFYILVCVGGYFIADFWYLLLLYDVAVNLLFLSNTRFWG